MATVFYKRVLTLIIITLSAVSTESFGQRVVVNWGVDTTDNEIGAVVALWTDYLKSKPSNENIQDSPFWAVTEKEKYYKVDQLLNAINSDHSTYLTGSPTILYVKPKHGFFEIKTLFSWTDSSGNVFVPCITSVFAGRENGLYKLYNALTVNSQQWKTQNIESITFHFPKTHAFDKNAAGKLLRSVDNLTKQWGLALIPIHYYMADTYEEIQNLRGLDYAIGMGNKDRPGGMADQETKTVFAGGLGENYFHEVVHIYLNNLFPKSSLGEGAAVFYGGSMGHDLKWHLRRLNNHLDQHPETDLSDLEKFWYMDNFTNPNSTIQGLLCYMAFKYGGLSKLKELMSHEDIYTAIEKEFGIKKDRLNTYLRQQIRINKN